MTVAQGKRKQSVLVIFIGLLTGIAIIISYYPIKNYIASTDFVANQYREIRDLAVLLAILSVARCLPMPTKREQGFDISSIVIYAIFIIKGLAPTILLLLISNFFTFTKWGGSKVSHLFNTSFDKTLYNNTNRIIPLYFAGLVYDLFYNQPGFLMLPDAIWASIAFLVVFMLGNSFFQAWLFHILTGIQVVKGTVQYFFMTFPTLIVLSPLGYFLAMFLIQDQYGPYTAILFFIPIMFARFAFKLYLDSKEQYFKIISTLSAAIEAKDKYTEGHSKRVEQYSSELGEAMGLRGSRIENIKVAAVLHDIGKIGIDDEILRKPGQLTRDEWDKIRQHPAIGNKILEEVDIPKAVRDMIHYHHVRYDMKGYPPVEHIKELPLEVHIISLADAYDAMTSDRPYRPAMPEEQAIQNLADGRGTQFHPDVVDAFLKLKHITPVK